MEQAALVPQQTQCCGRAPLLPSMQWGSLTSQRKATAGVGAGGWYKAEGGVSARACVKVSEDEGCVCRCMCKCVSMCERRDYRAGQLWIGQEQVR